MKQKKQSKPIFFFFLFILQAFKYFEKIIFRHVVSERFSSSLQAPRFLNFEILRVCRSLLCYSTSRDIDQLTRTSCYLLQIGSQMVRRRHRPPHCHPSYRRTACFGAIFPLASVARCSTSANLHWWIRAASKALFVQADNKRIDVRVSIVRELRETIETDWHHKIYVSQSSEWFETSSRWISIMGY